MSTVSDTVHPSTLDQIQANIVDWFEGISKGVELPIRFSHPSKSSNRLCLFSTPQLKDEPGEDPEGGGWRKLLSDLDSELI
jgi:hypothetical protein